jgi:hypothetical protein
MPALLLLLMPTVGFPQTPQPRAMLTVKGYTGQAPVIRINGKSYVDIESLARLTNGTLSFQGTQITLTIAGATATAAPAPPDPPAKLSRDFLQAVIGALSVIEEWRTGLVNAIQNNGPLTPEWADGFLRTAENKVSLASTTVATEPDRTLLPLLRTELTNMQALTDRYLALHKSQTFVAPDSLDNDPVNQQVRNCARGLAAVTASGQFQDVASCH